MLEPGTRIAPPALAVGRTDSSRASRFVPWKNTLSADRLPMIGGGGDGLSAGEKSFGRTGVLIGGGESGRRRAAAARVFFGKLLTSRRGPRDSSRLVHRL